MQLYRVNSKLTDETSQMVPKNKVTITRRQALIGALSAGALVSQAKAGDMCVCLPQPDCNSVCPNGGAPKADGSQACECSPVPVKPRALAQTDGGDALNATNWNGKALRKAHNSSATQVLVLSGDNIDYVNKADLAGSLADIVTAGSAGPSANKTVSRKGSFSVPYFQVNDKGQITSYATRTVTVTIPSYSAYSNYSNYSDYGNYTNYDAYSNYYAYNNYGAYTNTKYYSNYSAYGNYNDNQTSTYYGNYGAYGNGSGVCSSCYDDCATDTDVGGF